jgi:hypothetical protein
MEHPELVRRKQPSKRAFNPNDQSERDSSPEQSPKAPVRDAEVERIAAELTYDGAKDRLRLVARFARESDYDAVLLFVAQTWILDLLFKCWYLAFKGPKSSGKTRTTKMVLYLSKDGVHAGSLTAAVLAALMRTARCLSVDELDVLTMKHGETGEFIEGVFRLGDERGQPLRKMVPNPDPDSNEPWVPGEVPTFGPKVFNYASDVEDALASRADQIPTVRAKDPALRRRARRFERHLAPVKRWLEIEAERVLSEWSAASVEAWELSPEFEGLSDGLDVKLDRTGDIGDLMLTVAHVFGWSVEKVITERLGGIDEFSQSETTEEVRQAVSWHATREAASACAIAPQGVLPSDWSVVIARDNIRDRVDEGRREHRRKGIWSNALAESLRDLGFGDEVRVSATDRRKAIRVDRLALEKLGIHPGGGIVRLRPDSAPESLKGGYPMYDGQDGMAGFDAPPANENSTIPPPIPPSIIEAGLTCPPTEKDRAGPVIPPIPTYIGNGPNGGTQRIPPQALKSAVATLRNEFTSNASYSTGFERKPFLEAIAGPGLGMGVAESAWDELARTGEIQEVAHGLWVFTPAQKGGR